MSQHPVIVSQSYFVTIDGEFHYGGGGVQIARLKFGILHSSEIIS